MVPSFPEKFTLPITFTDTLNHSSIETSFAHSKPSVLRCWNYTHQSDTGNVTGPVRAAALGCHDGSLFLFHCFLSPPGRKGSRRTLSPRDRTRALPRSGSPTSLSPPPFYVPQRSRVVSGITAEQVEALKTCVDFEDETSKLKNMLEGRAPKEKSLIIETDTSYGPSNSASASSSENASIKGRENSRGVHSASTPSISFPKSPPASMLSQDGQFPDQNTTHKMNLVGHIVPSRAGVDHSVTAVSPLDNGRLFVVLRESGDIRVLSTQDGACVAMVHVDKPPLHAPTGVGDKGWYHDTCLWRGLKVAEFEETTLLIASAVINANAASFDPEGDETSERSKLAIFEVSTKCESELNSSVRLVKLFQWVYNGPLDGVTVLDAHYDAIRILTTSTDGTLSLRILSRTSAPDTTGHWTPDPTSGNPQASAEQNPFKIIKAHLLDKPQAHDRDEGGFTFTAADEHVLGALHLGMPLLGIRIQHATDQLMGLAWSHSYLKGFVYKGDDFQIMFGQSLRDFIDLQWVGIDSYCVIYEDRVALYEIQAVDANGDSAPADSTVLMHPSLQTTLKTGKFDALAVLTNGEAIYTRISGSGQRQILRLSKLSDNETEISGAHMLWRVPTINKEIIFPTSLIPLEDSTFIQGYVDGRIRRFNLSQLSNRSSNEEYSMAVSDFCMNGEVTSLHIVQNQRTKVKYIASGASDGSISFWTINTLTLCARWVVFTTPLSQVIQLPIERMGPLNGCLLCIAQDGTIAVVDLDDFQFLYMVPGSAISLSRVCLTETNLLLIYKDRRARLWDTQTKIFWRSLTQDKAEELLPQGGWTEMFLDRQDDGHSMMKALCDGCQAPAAASSLILNLERFLSDSATVIKTISTSKEQTKAIYSKIDQTRLVLSFLLTPGLNDGIDDICRTRLHIPASSALLGLSSLDTSTLYSARSSRDVWRISGDVSAGRLVAITAALRNLALFEEYTDSVKTITTFYTTALPGCVGSGFQAPSLPFLALLWLKSLELRPPCRSVFDAFAVRLSDDEAGVMVERWQQQLPSLKSNVNKESSSSALALYLCGHIAVEKYSITSSEVLRDISKSLSLYLQDDKSSYKILAIDLCSRGFHVWQHYIDAIDILRSLFNLATNTRKDSIDVQNTAAQARSSVLHIASSNTPLFMTTLGLDILNPPDLEHRRSVLQIVAFLIRKRPLVLYSNLPRLMEAVVKSLDPNSAIDRDAVLDIATDIISQVVKTFPNVDFHGDSQRLAVGSHEGAIIMYDLKTATRLYVLEAHKKRLSSCSFSTDGRRLVTVSIDEGLVHVWKVGSSFVSFFNPGAPPRQGHSGSHPYKTLNFHFGDMAEHANSMNSTTFEWVTARNVKIKIGPNTLFFST